VAFGVAKSLVCFAAKLLIFFIAGLLYLLRFERVDNLGAYRIPLETGLLIPSDFSSYHSGISARCKEKLPGHQAAHIP